MMFRSRSLVTIFSVLGLSVGCGSSPSVDGSQAVSGGAGETTATVEPIPIDTGSGQAKPSELPAQETIPPVVLPSILEQSVGADPKDGGVGTICWAVLSIADSWAEVFAQQSAGKSDGLQRESYFDTLVAVTGAMKTLDDPDIVQFSERFIRELEATIAQRAVIEDSQKFLELAPAGFEFDAWPQSEVVNKKLAVAGGCGVQQPPLGSTGVEGT